MNKGSKKWRKKIEEKERKDRRNDLRKIRKEND